MSHMAFSPEWMRKTPLIKPGSQASETQTPPSSIHTGNGHQDATHSAGLVSIVQKQVDTSHPDSIFRYTKEDMLDIYRQSKAKHPLSLEVKRWEGIIRAIAVEPSNVRGMTESESKLFSGPFNSELRRRQSTDPLSNGVSSHSGSHDRPRLNHQSSSNLASPMRERFGAFMGKRRESSDTLPSTGSRKLSLSSVPPPLSPRDNPMPSPRTGFGLRLDSPGANGESWMARRLAFNEASRAANEVRNGSGSHSISTMPTTNTIRENSETLTEIPQTSLRPAQHNIDISGDASAEQGSHDFAKSQASPLLANDLGQVEWSYLDTSGNIQGPFVGDMMQSWEDNGFFTPDLCVKRTRLDSSWWTVAELQRLTLPGGKIFLSPITGTAAPPRLASRLDSAIETVESLPRAREIFNTYQQPVSSRSVPTSTLGHYVGSASELLSPSSSSSSGAEMHPNNTDSINFGVRLSDNRYTATATDMSFGRDASAFKSESAPFRSGASDSRNIPFHRAIKMNEFHGDREFNQAETLHNINRAYDGGQSWISGPQSNLQLDRNKTAIGGQIQPSSSFSSQITNLRIDVPNTSQLQSHSTTYSPIHLATIQSSKDADHIQSHVQLSPFSTQPTGPSDIAPIAQSPLLAPAYPINTPQRAASSNLVTQESPWSKSDISSGNAAQSTESFTANYHDLSAQADNSQNSIARHSDHGIAAPLCLTAQNLGVHNQFHETSVSQPTSALRDTVPLERPVDVPEFLRLNVSPAVVAPAKSKRGSKVSSPVSFDRDLEPLESSTNQRQTAWAINGDNQTTKKVRNQAGSLRELQDAENKKEKKKTAERAQEKVVRALGVNPTSGAEILSLNETWGLPTSQAGNRPSLSKSPHLTTGTPVFPSVPVPVWTNVSQVKPTQKSMKEIQEEEEQRKKILQQEAAVSTARRAYADSTNKNTVPPPSASAAWTVVGSKLGQTSTRPLITAITTPAPTASPVSQPGSITNNNTRTKVIPKTAAAVFDTTPSTEFMKWLGTALKPLSSSANAAEITSMLLSFPLDPDPSTVEIIQDLIYASSTTLDGRRFAAEYIQRRKADLTPRRINASPAKPASIAEVVKAPPKAQQSEWGGFKVVNKKKKAPRS